MPHSLHVWEFPLPATVSEAAAAALDMGNEVVGQNPGFIVLARRLASRYPDARLAPGASVWGERALDGVTDRRAWQIAVVRERARVIPFVARQANLLGLCVFDMQLGMAWLPDGTVLKVSPTMRRRLAGPVRQTRLSRSDVTQELWRMTRGLFAPLGYVFEADGEAPCYRLALPDGWIRVLPLVWDHAPGFRLSFQFEIRHAGSAALAARFHDIRPELQHQVSSAVIHLRDINPGKEYHVDAHGLLRFYLELDELETLFRDRVLPLLEQCRTVAGLERHVNRAGRVRAAGDPGAHYAQDVAMAWLVGRKDWADIGARCLAALDARHVKGHLALERLIAHLHAAAPSRAAAALAAGEAPSVL